jgi:predicted O-methyltransferase YrrM
MGFGLNHFDDVTAPEALRAIEQDSAAIGFALASERRTGALLRTLAASKPGGRVLELGTGTGVGTAWILDGMNPDARLDTVDNDAGVVEIARRHLGHDGRVTFHVADGAIFVEEAPAGDRYDLIFADAWPGKFSHLDAALSLLKTGGIYVVDDLLPQSNWPEGHAPRVPVLMAELERRPGFVCTRLDWASGLMLVVRRS